MTVDLVRDVLDKQVQGPGDRPVGRVDGIVAELGEDGLPRLLALELGGTTLARRLHPRLGGWAERLARRWSPTGGTPFRIAWSRIRHVGPIVQVDLDADATPGAAWERFLRDRIIGRIPGA